MAGSTFNCKLITPVDRVFDAEVTYANVPMWDGMRGEMHNSGAVVGKLGPGVLRVDFVGGESKSWFIDGGFMQNVENELTILATGAEATDAIDAAAAKAELAEVEARTSTDTGEMDAISAERRRLRAKVAAASKR